MTQCLKVSKLDAARRQLETAILLYFNEADPVSVHTLAAASHEILKDLGLRTKSPMFLERTFEILPQALRDRIRQEVRRPQNFFKHADLDAEESIDFVPGMTEWTLLDAMAKYIELNGERTPMLRLYETWFATRYPELWNHTSHRDLIRRARQEVFTMSRKEFLTHFMSNGSVLMGVAPNQRLQRTADAAR
jgi:hypothetical protein